MQCVEYGESCQGYHPEPNLVIFMSLTAGHVEQFIAEIVVTFCNIALPFYLFQVGANFFSNHI